jgi:preprotein translocase subunit Sec63
MVEMNRKRLEKQARSRGDLMSQALLFGLSWLGPAITQATQRVPAPGPNPFASKAPAAALVDPFAVLGLETGCSEEDVRKRQREFAAILHADKGGGPTAAARLVEINTAAAECLKKLHNR